MAKVRSREDALLDAYLGRYKSAQASTVSEGQSKTKSAQQKGSAILNATDKTLPALKNTYSDTLQSIVSGANMENSLNNDVMQRSMNLAKAKFDAANDLYEQQKKAQEYAEKQAAKAAAAAAKSSGKKSSGSSSKSSTTSAADDTAADAEAALNKLGIGSNTTSKAKAGSGTTSKPSSNSKTDSKKKEKSVNPLTKALQDKQAAANSGANRGKTTGKSYAEQNNAQKVSTQSAAAARQESGKGAGKGAQSQSLTSAAKVVGGFLTAPARAGNEDEKRKQWQARQLEDSGRVFTKDGQINSRYQELEGSSKGKRSVGSRAADLVKGTAKQAAGALGTAFLAPTSGGSKENKQAQYKMRQMMDNGTVFTADGGINPDYQKAQSGFDATKDKQDVLSEQFVPTLGLIREGQNQIAQGGAGLTGAGKGLYDASAMFANMVPGMALGVANPALGAAFMGATAAGNKIAEQTEKGRGSRDATLRGAASGLIEAGTNALPIGEFAKTVKTGSPILQSALKEGIENAGQEAASYLLNTAADYALKDPDANFSLQDMAGQVGMGAATGAAFGALGGALGKAFGRADAGDELAGNARPYEDAADIVKPVQDVTPVESQPSLIDRIQQANTPDETNRAAVDRLAEFNSELDLNAAKERELQQLREEVMRRAKEIGDEAVNSANTVSAFDVYRDSYIPELQRNLQDTAAAQRANAYADLQSRLATAATQSEMDDAMLAYDSALENLPTMGNQAQAGNIDGWQETPDIFLRRPVDETAQTAYNVVNGGVGNENLGGYVQEPVSVGADSVLGNGAKPGNVSDGLYGTNGTAGQGTAAQGNGRGVEGAGAASVPTVAERASAITGKDMRSPYTRRIASLFERLGNGESREALAGEAKDIALGIVSTDDFTTPVDESTTVLKDYLKNTPIKIDEQTKGELLSASGLKTLQQYNIQNGTHFSMKDGVDYDAAIPEAYGMMGSGSRVPDGNAADALMQLVSQSKQKALVDSDAYTAYTDYVSDSLLNGQRPDTEGFTDWLETQGFDKNANESVRNMYVREFEYDPWGNSYNSNVLNRVDNAPAADVQSVPALEQQTAQSVSEAVPAVEQRLLNGSESVPENAVGAQSTQYDRREVLNQDYANQRVMTGDMTGEEAAQLGIGQQTHTVYSRAEGHNTAMQDFDLLIQQQGGVTNAARTIADELTQAVNTDKWDAENVYKGYYAAEQLHQRLGELDPNSAEAAVVKAQIQRINGAVSAGQSKAGQTLVSGRWAQPDEYMALRKLDQYNRDAVDRFARTTEGRRLNEVAQDVADTFTGPMDDEFTAFVQSQGVNTGNEVRDQMEYLAGQIQRMGQAHNVDINAEQARTAAASVQAGGTIEDIYGAFARQSLGIGDLSQEDFDYAVDAFSRIRDMPDSRERYELEMSVYNRMANYMPARGFSDRLNNIRYLCMLGNTRTHIRNIMGNVMMGTVARAKDNVAGVMQLALPQNERTKAVGTTLTADGRQMVQRAREYADSNMYSTLFQDGRWNMDTGLQAARNTFTTAPGRVIERLSDINGNALEAEDNFFLRSEFGNSMASFLKARGYDSSIFDADDAHSRNVIQQAAAQALADAREATFHEDNFLSTAFQNLSRDVRNRGPAGTLAHVVIEGILPFKKTPINIAKNALEYNAVGGTVEAIYRGATGQGAARVMDATAKGVTGSAIMGAGFLLAKNGMLTGGASGDDRADAYKEMTGEQNYAVKIPGKGTYTLDWASPASVPLLIGAEIANDNTDLTVGQVLDKVRHLSQPVLETTMLQGLNDTLDSISYADSNDKLATLGVSAVGSYANQFVPTMLGQVARAADDTRRSTYGGGDTKTERDVGYNLRKMESKIPGLSQNLEPYVDQWGREEASLDGTDDSAGGMFLRGLYNMGSPGYYSAENVTPVDEYLQGLYSDTNNSKVLPEKASSKLTLDKETYYMTPEEKTEYAKTTGQTAYDLVDSLRQNDMFLQLPDDQQAELVQSAYTVAKTAGGVAAVGDGVSGVDSTAYKAYKQGGVDGVTDYLLAKNAVDVAKGDSDTMSGTEKWNAIRNTLDTDAAAEQFVLQQGEKSTANRVYSVAGSEGLAAYMDAYSSLSAGLEEGKSPSRKDMSKALLNSGLDSNTLAETYLSAYKDDDKAASVYGKYGADAMQQWLRYYAAADLDGNGSITQKEAQATLDQMNLTEQLKAAYWQMTNKTWKANKNPY